MAYSEAFGGAPDAPYAVAAPSAPSAPSAASARVAGWLGAISSVALLAGLAFWVQDLATRDARSVPVVRAMDGPARVQPEDPGGFEAPHQGLTVNSVASDTPDAPLSERVVLAPEPVGPAPEDVPAPAAAAPEDPAASLRKAIDGALSEVLGTAPAGAARERDAPSAAPRPTRRPDPDLATRAATATGLAAADAALPATRDPADIPVGTRLVQLGSFVSEAAAKEAWAALDDRFGAYMRSAARVIETADLGGQTAYRLQAYGFDTLAQARGFCAVLLAAKADCIPTLKR